jgi:uncharacterized repeat protein (TIGR03803 family)
MQRCISNLLLVWGVLAATASILGGRLTAQTFSTIYSFTGAGDGAQPFAGLSLSNNILYGTTLLEGGSGDGTVFALNPDGTGFKTLYSFNGFNDGFYAQGPLTLSDGVLYGTTHFGGPANNGTVFAMNIDGMAYTVLHSFTVVAGSLPYQTNSDGANPQAGLLLSAGTLYGTAVYGGSAGYGAVFALNTDGTGFKTLHSFTAPSGAAETNSDGANPYGGLILAASTLYGTARLGGSSGHGTVFALNTDGSSFKTLRSFSGTNDGGTPFAGLTLSSNMLYGTALQGRSAGQGALFAINIDGTGFTTLHSFSGASDGANPAADLILSGNTLYGTASYGGNFGNGTVFAVHTDGKAFTNLYSFTATSGSPATNSDGANPSSRLILCGNTLYGTAKGAGSSGQGTLFSISLGPVSAPAVTVTRSGANVILTWPVNACGFSLRSTTNLAPPAVWTSVSPGPVLLDGQNTVTNPLSGPQRFYRLTQ